MVKKGRIKSQPTTKMAISNAGESDKNEINE
jgi:hypothetical protein